MRYLVLMLAVVTSLSFAETPTDRAKMYFSDMEDRNFAAAAGHIDADQLKEFRQMMGFYKEIPQQAQAQFIQTFFGPDQTVETIEKVTDVEFFSGLFSFIMSQADAAGGVNFDGVEILGEVKEGNIIHLVTRNRVSMGMVEVEAMEVISLKKSGNEWRILMSGNIKGLPQQLRAAFSPQN